MNYMIYWTSLGWRSQEIFKTLEEAKEYARKTGFNGTIYKEEYEGDPNAVPICSWDPLSGFRTITEEG